MRTRPSRFVILILVCGVLPGMSACVTARVEELRQTTGSASADDGIVIMVNRQHAVDEAEESFADCVNSQLARRGRNLKLQSEDDFKDGLFPWFEPRLAPSTPEELPALLARPGVADRIADTGVRYLVWVTGSTEIVGGGGNLSCGAGPGGAGCLGFTWWEKASSYEASIWDLYRAESAGTISADASGTSYMPAIIVPVPLIARTQTAACKGLAEQLKQFLTGEGA